MTEMTLGDLERELDLKKRAFFKQHDEAWARNNPVASDLDPTACLRRQVHEVVSWQQKPTFDEDTLERLAAGKRAERTGLALLADMGVDVELQQAAFKLEHRTAKRKVVGGKVDGVLVARPWRVVLEIKLVNPWMFDAIVTWRDLFRWWWTRKYVYQGQVYMIGLDREGCVFMLHDGKRWKFVAMPLEYDLAEEAWHYAEAASDAIVAYQTAEAETRDLKSLPDFTKDLAQCGRCAFFRRVCNPPLVEGGAEFVANEEDEAMLERWWELRPAKREYDALDRRLKPRMRTGPRLKVVGSFTVERVARGDGEAVVIERMGAAREDGATS